MEVNEKEIEILKNSLVDFIPKCLKTGFKYGELDKSQKEELESHIDSVNKIMDINKLNEIEFEPYLCFLKYLNSGNFKDRYSYELCIQKAVKKLK